MRHLTMTFMTSSWVCVALLWGCIAFAADAVIDEPERSAETQQAVYGAYLTRIGNCMGCHTTKGGQPFAGGRRLSTSFGIFVTPNITPDKATGIGRWNEEDFWQALHQLS